ncbi:hypothetical protein HBI56_145820 [Parastagonospora nodorum]|nr:hypothetical protein HBH56_079060 [Parastagonospora nodorum]KAH3923434.1 hypothetical protein HBH54_208900 [Parastagonospora nodorum]KAH3995692.1 hypothetical protein HBI10_166680 [Parastagonospora nodorum]KAH4015624.1 hypothetical protein HBI13_156270 [Parastagonospora nodorum]KAH4139238.1 hypothetical protein HBH45_095700 [Parastagonospora nodorum]
MWRQDQAALLGSWYILKTRFAHLWCAAPHPSLHLDSFQGGCNVGAPFVIGRSDIHRYLEPYEAIEDDEEEEKGHRIMQSSYCR